MTPSAWVGNWPSVTRPEYPASPRPMNTAIGFCWATAAVIEVDNGTAKVDLTIVGPLPSPVPTPH